MIIQSFHTLLLKSEVSVVLHTVGQEICTPTCTGLVVRNVSDKQVSLEANKCNT